LSSRVFHRALNAVIPSVRSGRGSRLILEDGQEIIDASGGAAVACIGHGDRRVVEAMARQAGEIDYVHSTLFTTGAAEALASLILDGEPGGLERALFVSSGSEAMEAAIKLARQYFVEAGQPDRTCFIARRQSYHGATLAALALGGHRARRAAYEPMLSEDFSQVSPCFPYRWQAPGEDDQAYVARLKTELEAEFQRIGPGRVAAFCAETVVGATTGCVAAVPGYFAAMREVCDRHGALLILDEVMCGMGRTGISHAWQAEGVAPDIQTIGKGLGGGYQPIGAVLASRRVVQALSRGSGGFMHGQTYQAHPVACAAALEVQRIIRDEDLTARAAVLGDRLDLGLRQALGAHPHVGDIRGRGLFLAVELVADRDRRAPFAPGEKLAERLKDAALRRGVAVYPGSGTADGTRGDHVLLAPPFNAAEDEIDAIVERLALAVMDLSPA
jgi:adenosylmethionine-8-amino-7-oxononanoate aminotransferase